MKSLGQFPTPEYVARFMIELASTPQGGKILEPSCGEGIFLKLLQERGYTNCVGYETDTTIKPLSGVDVVFKSFVSAEIKEQFDLVIGNPPYIRWKNLDAALKEELSNNHLWNRYFNSLCDYLCIFILKSVELLKEQGELIFITPEYWINTKHAQSLRSYLLQKGYFTDIIHFNETPIFDNVASSILIFKFVKSACAEHKKRRIRVVKYLMSQKLTPAALLKAKNNTPDAKIEIFERRQFQPQERWMLVSDAIAKKLEEFENKCIRARPATLFGQHARYPMLGDIADIGNGMVSGLDKAFQIPAETRLNLQEENATISVLKAKNLDQYVHRDLHSYIFLNGAVEGESELKNKFPNFYKLLAPFRERLKLRYSYNREINYWDWAFLRSFGLFKQNRERIFVPCKERISHKSYFRFAYVSAGIFPTQDVTAIFLKPEIKESIYYILAQLNSDNVFQWLRHKGVVKGNIVEFSEKPLASIPIKLIDWGNQKEVELHDRISFLCQRYIACRDQEKLGQLETAVALLSSTMPRSTPENRPSVSPSNYLARGAGAI